MRPDGTAGGRSRPVRSSKSRLTSPRYAGRDPPISTSTPGTARSRRLSAIWDWSRAGVAGVSGGTAILYDVRRRGGDDLSIAMHVDHTGRTQDLECPPAAALPTTLWRMRRTTRTDSGHRPRILQTFEDAPFYARSLLESQLMGTKVTAIHESLSLDRFRAPWVRALLPFRMPRFDH